jgi:hypothetical protein
MTRTFAAAIFALLALETVCALAPIRLFGLRITGSTAANACDTLEAARELGS